MKARRVQTAKKRRAAQRGAPARNPRMVLLRAKGAKCALVTEPRSRGGDYVWCDNWDCAGKCKLYVQFLPDGVVQFGCACLELY
ncbi:MAG TPA: hypothetical protein VGU22_04795 [Methylomirabilota bacterium]|jgi:hypothetical protein|nr:hypothetical protein [Methylomirabilota bacterium]